LFSLISICIPILLGICVGSSHSSRINSTKVRAGAVSIFVRGAGPKTANNYFIAETLVTDLPGILCYTVMRSRKLIIYVEGAGAGAASKFYIFHNRSHRNGFIARSA
jgi:hypothetical protein